MKKVLFMACTAMIMAACGGQSNQTSESQVTQWVQVEGNKFIDADGKELVFRGLCFSDPVKLVRGGQWTERHFEEAAD